MPTTRAAVGWDDGWRRIMLLLGAAGTAGTIYKILRGRKPGAMELLSAAAFLVGLLGDGQ